MANIKTRRLTAEELLQDPLRCPACSGQNLTLEGTVSRVFTEVVEQGAPSSYTVDESQTYQSIEQIFCRDCQLLLIIESEQVQELMKANFLLADALKLKAKNTKAN